MNTYYDFLEKIHPYLKSVRKLNTHISYDLTFSDRWVMPKTKSQVIEVVKNGNELKVVFPQSEFNLDMMKKLSFEHYFLQPMDSKEIDQNTKNAISYCLKDPVWKLSIQQHKLLGID